MQNDPESRNDQRTDCEADWKAPYRKPELTEWGSIFELTGGPINPTPQDFPFQGGSNPT